MDGLSDCSKPAVRRGGLYLKRSLARILGASEPDKLEFFVNVVEVAAVAGRRSVTAFANAPNP
jgi:hypothetical protein